MTKVLIVLVSLISISCANSSGGSGATTSDGSVSTPLADCSTSDPKLFAIWSKDAATKYVLNSNCTGRLYEGGIVAADIAFSAPIPTVTGAGQVTVKITKTYSSNYKINQIYTANLLEVFNSGSIVGFYINFDLNQPVQGGYSSAYFAYSSPAEL